ncbi:ROK family protein [Thermosediminibacter litoriperuensis]|uniref:Glucokinase n=1 Tax=Thermosediminibacter litoriperuensis TaxID=291989 RepID=A0A5S5AH36_9FIRM|nr:ROK family protein [Thermosediminibacter litoriperuensis]TYP49786.1 glucokinase [Thermosediminibacter litoriperuensis]
MKKIAVGIDLGGTKIATCAMDEAGNLLEKTELPTLAKEGPEKVIERMKRSVYEVLKRLDLSLSDIAGIGIGVPGPMDAKRGRVKNPPNLPGWKDIPLLSIMEEEFNIPVFMENDANAAAIAENLFGAGKGVKNFIYITISTGIGGGAITNGRLFKGGDGNAAEVGHMTINFEGPVCGCGNSGCWEAYASGTALTRFAREGILSGRKTRITDLAGQDEVRAEHVFAAAKEGDEFARELVEKEGFYLGVGLANVVNAYNPERIAIGGGLTHAWDMFYSTMVEVMKTRALPANVEHLEVMKAKLGTDVGTIGAASLVFHKE